MSIISTSKSPVIITAVGRSGTTIIDKLLTHILKDYEGSPCSIYEPFLWNHRALRQFPDYNDPHRYDSFENISSEGIFYHTHFPLFMDESYLTSDKNQIYLEGFERYLFEYREDDENPSKCPRYLMKFIRANGRLPLLSKLMPDGRFILLVRNPLDVINSVINIFSLHGDEFHKSDYPRLQKSVKAYFDEDIPDHQDVPAVLKEAYWAFYQAMIALDYAQNDDRFLIIPYEGLKEDPVQYVRKICSHIGVPFVDEYMNVLATNVGNSASNIVNISVDQINLIMPIFDRYVDELEKRIDYKLNTKEIVDKYISKDKSYEDLTFIQDLKPETGHHASYYIQKILAERISNRTK